jgi:hypothetical protein
MRSGENPSQCPRVALDVGTGEGKQSDLPASLVLDRVGRKPHTALDTPRTVDHSSVEERAFS